MKYYAIQVKDNEELSVKENILKKFDKIKIHIPIERKKTKTGNYISIFYERSWPEYLMVECEDCAQEIKKMRGMANIETVIMEDMPYREVKRFLREAINFEDSKFLARINEGPYSGGEGLIGLIEEDCISIVLKNKNTAKVPVWHVEQRIAIDDMNVMGR